MTRPYYRNLDDEDYCRRSSRGMSSHLVHERSLALATSHVARADPRAFSHSLATHEARNSPPQEADTDNSNTQPRRRIAVACGRCRKRKIKCSGDPGNGQGCNNCKQAGTDPGQCQFLRVNSLTTSFLDCEPSAQPTYYELTGSSRSSSGIPQLGNNSGAYPVSTNSPMPSMGSSYSSTSAHYSRMPSHQGFSSGSYPSRSIKQAYPTSYSMGFNDDAVEPYTITSPPCMLPNQDVVSMGSIYNNQDTLRWNPIIQHKVPSGGLLIDQDSPPSYGGLNLPYFNSTSRMSASMPAMASESAAFFPGLTSLAASLPAPTPSGDRILPNPTTGRTQLPNSSATLTHGSLNDTPLLTSYGSGNGLNYKSSAPWGTESIGSSSSQSYSGTISAHPQNVMTVPSTANSTASTVRDSSLTYIPISHSPGAGAGSSTSSLTYNTTNLPTPSTPHSAYTNTNSTTSMFPTSSSNEALLPSHGSSSNLYSYSSDSSARRDSSSDTMDSDGTLVSGHQYTQIPHPQSQHHATFEVLPRGRTSESRPHTAHRTSIASLSHSREF